MAPSPFDADALPPVAADDVCGPDLDLGGDSEFLNFMAAMEGQLPAAYFSFDRKAIDFPAAFETGEKLLKRSHDLRLLVLLAKLAILNRDLAGFSRRVGAIAWLLSQHWEEAHPRADDGDYAFRLAQLASLDDGPVAVLPLQYAPLVESQRDGAAVFRAQLIAAGEVRARDGDMLPSPSAMDRILSGAPIEALVERHGQLRDLGLALNAIATITAERVGFESAVVFKALTPLVERMTAFLAEALARRDPSLAQAPVAPAGDAASGGAPVEPAPAAEALETLADVDAALASALGYFALREPSSPALLLIGQARATLGKNLYEVMRLLAPNHADKARVFVGPDNAFTVPVSGLAEQSGEAPSVAASEPAATRAAALAQIERVGAHMRRVEPSSPVPHLLERARTLASRDFASLLAEVLPEEDIEAMKRGQ